MAIPSLPHVSRLLHCGPCRQETESECEAPGNGDDGEVRLAGNLVPLLHETSNSKN